MLEKNSDYTKLSDKIAAILAEKPSTMVRNMALELGFSELEITRCLPKEMHLELPKEDFVQIWESMCLWGKFTFLAETSGAILEIAGELPKGRIMHGMYNLMDKNFALGGHILMENICHIWLVSKPAFGLESHSVQFFSAKGQPCFSVYLGRDSKRNILPQCKDGYMKLWNKYIKGVTI